jgi:hypothetical protein
MTQTELIAALPPGRLPPDLMGFGFTDVLMLFGAGLIVSAILSALLIPILTRRPSRKTLIRATRGLPPGERLLAIARILGHLPEKLRPAAYGSAPPPPSETIERIALNARKTD